MLVEPLRLTRAERHHAAGLAAGDDRQEHQRAGADRVEQPRDRRRSARARRGTRPEPSAAAAARPSGTHLGEAALSRARRRANDVGQRLEHRLDLRVGADAGDAPERRPVGEIDVAGVGEPGHRHLSDPRGDLLLVERAREELARLGEQAQAVVGALPVGDLHDHGADADHLAVGSAHRVVAREPVAALAHPQRFVVGRLRVHDRLTRLQHTAVERLEHGAELADHVGQRLPDVLLGSEPVDRGERVVHADEAELPVPEADPDRRRDEQRVELCVRLLRGAEEERVVDRERRSARDLVRELEVDRAEAPSRLARAERDRPEQATARLERDDDVRRRFECAVELEVLLVDRRPGERLLARVLDEVRLAAPEHLRDRMRLVLLRRIAAPHLAQELLARRVAVRDHDLPQGPALVERVDDAVVRDARHEQLGEIGERGLVVERGREQGARLAEEVHPLLLVPLVRDVAEDVDDELNLSVRRQERRRAHDRPALVPSRGAAGSRALLPAPSRSARARRFGSSSIGDRPAILADDLEPRQQLRAGEPRASPRPSRARRAARPRRWRRRAGRRRPAP